MLCISLSLSVCEHFQEHSSTIHKWSTDVFKGTFNSSQQIRCRGVLWRDCGVNDARASERTAHLGAPGEQADGRRARVSALFPLAALSIAQSDCLKSILYQLYLQHQQHSFCGAINEATTIVNMLIVDTSTVSAASKTLTCYPEASAWIMALGRIYFHFARAFPAIGWINDHLEMGTADRFELMADSV